MKIEWPLNDEQTKSMLITTYQKFHELPLKQLYFFIKDHKLEEARVEKLLGVNIDQNITWKSHTDKVYKTVSMVLTKFRQFKLFLPVDV